jgi:hypothetical protein
LQWSFLHTVSARRGNTTTRVLILYPRRKSHSSV